MLYWTAIFFIIALIAACIGFGGVVMPVAAGIARFLFFSFLILAVVALFQRNDSND